jgi:hypothetical protein
MDQYRPVKNERQKANPGTIVQSSLPWMWNLSVASCRGKTQINEIISTAVSCCLATNIRD